MIDHATAKSRQTTPPAAQRVRAGVDVGAAKACCLIADEGQGPLIGAGMLTLRPGPKARTTSYDEALAAIRVAIDDAERAANAEVETALAAYSGAGLKSVLARGRVVLSGPADQDAARAALLAAMTGVANPARTLLHLVPIAYQVGDLPPTSDPRGLVGETLTVEACVVTAPSAAIDGLSALLSDAGVKLERAVAGPYAAGLSVLSPEERQKGVVIADIGAGGTSVAAFHRNGLIAAECLPVGADRIIATLAERLATSFAAAERALRVHGCFDLAADAGEQLEIPRLDGEGRLRESHVSRAAFMEPLADAYGDIFAAIQAWGDRALPDFAREWRIVLTGGAAQVRALVGFAAAELGRPIRVGGPQGLDGAGASAFAACAGLLKWAHEPAPEARFAPRQSASPPRRAAAVAKAAPPPLAPARAAAGEAWSWFKRNI